VQYKFSGIGGARTGQYRIALTCRANPDVQPGATGEAPPITAKVDFHVRALPFEMTLRKGSHGSTKNVEIESPGFDLGSRMRG
jgi:hypothetical protein